MAAMPWNSHGCCLDSAKYCHMVQHCSFGNANDNGDLVVNQMDELDAFCNILLRTEQWRDLESETSEMNYFILSISE
jgi:hypothetical protein